MRIETDPAATTKLASYPEHVRARTAELRRIILRVAEDSGVRVLEETLKWGEPSYLAPRGSTLRFDWKERAPDRLSLYFNCNSRLVPTIREVFGEVFDYEKNRAIHLDLDCPFPQAELQECVRMALCYHDVKHDALLGYRANDR